MLFMTSSKVLPIPSFSRNSGELSGSIVTSRAATMSTRKRAGFPWRDSTG